MLHNKLNIPINSFFSRDRRWVLHKRKGYIEVFSCGSSYFFSQMDDDTYSSGASMFTPHLWKPALQPDDLDQCTFGKLLKGFDEIREESTFGSGYISVPGTFTRFKRAVHWKERSPTPKSLLRTLSIFLWYGSRRNWTSHLHREITTWLGSFMQLIPICRPFTIRFGTKNISANMRASLIVPRNNSFRSSTKKTKMTT